MLPYTAQSLSITSHQILNPRSVTINWNQVAGAEGYILSRSHQEEGVLPSSTIVRTIVEGGSNLSHTFTGLTPYDYSSSNGVIFMFSVSAYISNFELLGTASSLVTITLPRMFVYSYCICLV